MSIRITRLAVLVSLTVAVTLSTMELLWARQSSRTLHFSEAEIFLELNDTDGDLGIHGSIDGGPWTSLNVAAPDDRTLLEIFSRRALQQQGMTQLSFESAEPPFDELDPADFFRRFPEGVYEIEGRAQNGSVILGKAVLSHVLAAAPENVRLSGVPAAESCDATPLPTVDAPVVISWDPVTDSHDDIGKPGPVRISRYQLFVERQNVKFSVDLPPTVTDFEVPGGVTALGRDFKFEIIARTTAGNNTAIESCFVVR